MNPGRILVLYGVDEQTPRVDAEVAHETAARAEEALSSHGWQVQVSLVTNDLRGTLARFDSQDWLVLNLCEGSPGQPFYYALAAEELERRGFAYTGSDPVALHETQFKPVMKRMFEAAQVPTPRWSAADKAEDLAFEFFPAIVKPAAEHCSYGITRDSVVFNETEARRRAGDLLHQYPGGVLIEEFLDSEEYGISLWGDAGSLEIIGISVIQYEAFADLRDRLCTYDAKWLPESDAYKKTMPVCPAPLEPLLQSELEALSRRTHEACGARDYSRVDVRLRAGRPMVLDLNVNCAISPNSGFAETLRIAGCDYGSMLERLLELAARRNKKSHRGSAAQPPERDPVARPQNSSRQP